MTHYYYKLLYTQAQYVFLHDVILEALNDAAPVKDAKEKIADLANIEHETDEAGIETKYEVASNMN